MDEAEAVALYLGGESVRGLVRKYEVSRTAIETMLVKNQVPQRAWGSRPTDGKSSSRRFWDKAKKDTGRYRHHKVKKYLAHVKRTYGLSPEAFDSLYSRQQGACDVCQKPLLWKVTGSPNFHVDHCHNTGTVRGLLCGTCNVTMGHLGDDPERIQKMADYLRRYPC